MADRDQIFQRLCHEAVLACGADINAVQRYVLARIEALSVSERQKVTRDMERVIRCHIPDRSRHGAN